MQITRIPAKRNLRRKQVAAYCRVSTNRFDQEDSFETQQAYYTELIKKNEDWEFAGIYSDEKSGTRASNRPGFQSMMDDALAGKVDIILVKSVSRFARNVVDCEQTVKLLAGYGISIYFEKEMIHSLDPSSSMVLSMMAAIAQDESRSISENVKWAHRERVRRGEYKLGNNQVLGYDSRNGKPVPNADADKIRTIYDLFLRGLNFREIASKLGEKGITGLRNTPITSRGVAYILRNEIYVGDKCLQKQAPKDLLTKQPDWNVEFISNYLKNDHEGIISRSDWNRAQKLLERKSNFSNPAISNMIRNHHPLYGKVFCAACEAPYIRKTALLSTDENGKRTYHKVWKCSEREKGKNGNECKNTIVPEDTLMCAICSQMGWEWSDAQHFPFEKLDEIEYVEVGKEGIVVYEK